jgi:hypothetical protein
MLLHLHTLQKSLLLATAIPKSFLSFVFWLSASQNAKRSTLHAGVESGIFFFGKLI